MMAKTTPAHQGSRATRSIRSSAVLALARFFIRQCIPLSRSLFYQVQVVHAVFGLC